MGESGVSTDPSAETPSGVSPGESPVKEKDMAIQSVSEYDFAAEVDRQPKQTAAENAVAEEEKAPEEDTGQELDARTEEDALQELGISSPEDSQAKEKDILMESVSEHD